jgi:SAM-dependent methyltransferase
VSSPSAPGQHASRRAADVARETLKTFALTHNYNKWVIDMMTPFIGRKLLEVGCGIGNLTYYLQDRGALTCIDLSELYLAHMRIDFPDVRFLRQDAAGDELRGLAGEGFDTIVCVNVLEHIEEDRRALANFRHVLAPGGRLLLHVPAMSSLYGTLDRNLDHFRRYDRKELRARLNDAGFEVERLYYCNLPATLGWYWNARVLRKREIATWPTILFDKFVPLIAAIERRCKPPFGMSLFAVARRPEH